MSLHAANLKLLSEIKNRINSITPDLNNRAVLTVGQYTLDALQNGSPLKSTDIIRVHHRNDLKNKSMTLSPMESLPVETDYEPHYWFDLNKTLDTDQFLESLRQRLYKYHEDALTVTNIGEGCSSGVLPLIHRALAEEGKNTLAVTLIPSMGHSSDALFNAFAALGLLLNENTTPVLMVCEDNMEQYVGVHRGGSRLESMKAFDYIIKLMLENPGFLRDFYTLSSNFNIRTFTPLVASGCSLDIYGSFRNILEITLEQPLLDVDLSSSSMVYVIVKAPKAYTGMFTKGQIEYEVSQWLMKSLDVDIPGICEPIFVDELNDRVDVLILIGGFDASPVYRSMYERIERFSDMNLEQELMDAETWEQIKETLLKETATA